MRILSPAFLAACLLAAAVPGWAQAPAPAPSPTPSPSPAPSPEPTPITTGVPPVSGIEPPAGGRPLSDVAVPPPEGQVAQRLPPWLISLRLRETWEDNPRFGEGGEEEDTFIDNAGLTLSRAFRGARGQLTLSGSGRGARYHSDSDLNRFSWSAGVTAAHRFTPRTLFTLREEVVSAYTSDASLLSGGGVLLALERTLTSHGGVELAHQVSSRSTLAANVRYDRVDFPEAELPDGSELALGARFTRQVSATDGLDLTYVHQRSVLGPNTQPAHSLHAGWHGTRGRRFAFSLGGGVSYLPATVRSERRFAPFGLVQGSLRGRRGEVSARYSRSVSQAFGLGLVREGDLVSVTVNRSLTTWLSAFGNYGFGRSHDIFDPDFVFDVQGYEGGLRASLSRDLALTAIYGQRRASTRDAPATVGGAGHLSLTYSRGF